MVSAPSWIAEFTGLSPRAFGKLVTVLWRESGSGRRSGFEPEMEAQQTYMVGAEVLRSR